MELEKICAAPLFAGMNPEEVSSILQCLQAQKKEYQRGETIFPVGKTIDRIGLVLSGSVMIERDDYWGNRSILTAVGEGEIFGETYACLPAQPADICAVAAQKGEILFLQVGRMLRTCQNACPFHARLIANLLEVSAQKNRQLSLKLDILSKRTTREKLLSYLSSQAVRTGSSSFSIPFNRQQLADFLSVDRSAMTVELGKLKKEGIIDFEKHQFRIL